MVLSLFIAVAASGQTPATVNRTLPQVEPPKTGLAFSANPTAEELFQAHVFEEPLVPVGGEPSAEENAALGVALRGYAQRGGPDDFSSLTDFLEQHPQSAWRAALLTSLGLECYNTAHYSLALKAWSNAWALAKDATDPRAKAIMDRAVGELAFMFARLGRMTELEALLKSVEQRVFVGPAAGRITAAREGLWTMKNRPEIAFRCGPLALRSLKHSLNPHAALDPQILNSASTQQGFSLAQVAELSTQIGLNYQMAFRAGSAEPQSVEASERNAVAHAPGLPRSDAPTFIVPCVVHWKVGHYAALVRKEGDLYFLQDPTFGTETWATKEALEAETSGYFLIPPGLLPAGWRRVDEKEGGAVWGKGQPGSICPGCITTKDFKTPGPSCRAMAVPSIHLLTANLNLNDEPLGYIPPVGPPVRLLMRYNHRESFQPANFNYSNFGHGWTCDWISYITDNPTNALADVILYMPGGGERTFTGFDPSTQTFAPQQYDQTLLKRTGAASYELTPLDGSKLVFSQSDGAIGTSRRVFLTQRQDSTGNTLSLTYDSNLRIVALTDAIGQVTTLTYGLSQDIYKVTQVTDPFGRFATFDYTQVNTDWIYTNHNDCPTPFVDATPIQDTWLRSITDVIGLTSQFSYLVKTNFLSSCAACPTNPASLTCVSNDVSVNFIVSLTTPYGVTGFAGQDLGNTRTLEIAYPDGSRERVEYNQTINIPPEPAASVPAGMSFQNANLQFRNTYYWSRTACALGYGDYSKAKVYHWLHSEDLSTAADALESLKEPLEGRIWFDYSGQGSPIVIGPSTRPTHIGRVLDDGSTQLYTYDYNTFGRVTKLVDPMGRTFTYNYDTNGIDLLEIRQTRGANNELLFKATYNSQHRPLSATDVAGQTTTFTYNPRGQVLTVTNPRNETITLSYDGVGYLLAVDGPLPGATDTALITYDPFGRVRTATSVSGDTLTLDYDNFDRITRVTYPDGTQSESIYDRLNLASFRDRAGRVTLYGYDSLRQPIKVTDPLGRVTLLDWCRCGALKSLTDPMGRTTSWTTDVQGRKTAKQYADGTMVRYIYENTASRVRQVIDEKQQMTFFTYNRDDTLRSIAYGNAAIPTPSVSFTYDPDYVRPLTMIDGLGTTRYGYFPVAVPPALGAGGLASVDGPFANDTISYAYDELGRPVQTAINGVPELTAYDAAGRLVTRSNALGSFSFTYDGGSGRPLSISFPNGQTTSFAYGDGLHDRRLQQITHTAGSAPVSQFSYVRDLAARRITAWSQQGGAQTPSVFTFGYDAVNQLTSALVTNAGGLVNTFGYTYDPGGNRLTEQVGTSTQNATYNGLNQISTATAPAASRTNEWDAAHRLTAVNVGNQRTEFTYDGWSRLVAIRTSVNGSEVSHRRFLWSGGQIGEERDASGANVTKRFFAQGVKLETGSQSGIYYYTRDHLGSIREVTDGSGTVRARYSYDPFGRRTKVSGDVDADFGFAGMFYSSEAALAFARFRAYDPELGRWLSRDPLGGAEFTQGPNLYAYVGNGPVNHTDRSGLLNGERVMEYAVAGATGAALAYYAGPALNSVDATCRSQIKLCLMAGLSALGGGVTAAVESGAGDTLEMDAVNCEAPSVAAGREIEANPSPNVEIISTKIEEGDIPPELNIDVEARAADLKTTYDEMSPTMQADYEAQVDRNQAAWRAVESSPDARGMLGNVPPAGWTDEMIQLDRVFYNLAQAYQRQNGGSFDEAWAAIARLTGFNPEDW